MLKTNNINVKRTISKTDYPKSQETEKIVLYEPCSDILIFRALNALHQYEL